MPNTKASTFYSADLVSDMGIRAQANMPPIVEEAKNTPPPLAAEFDYLRDMVIRNTHQMEEVRALMKRLKKIGAATGRSSSHCCWICIIR